MKFLLAKTEGELEDVYKVRELVFIEEQEISADLEFDEFEKTSHHFALYNKKRAVGAGRLRVFDDVGKVERVCVLKENRKDGCGRSLMEGIEEFAKESKLNKLILSAQTSAIPFYEKLGYIIVSEQFMEAGIPHKKMEKILK